MTSLKTEIFFSGLIQVPWLPVSRKKKIISLCLHIITHPRGTARISLSQLVALSCPILAYLNYIFAAEDLDSHYRDERNCHRVKQIEDCLLLLRAVNSCHALRWTLRSVRLARTFRPLGRSERFSVSLWSSYFILLVRYVRFTIIKKS